MAGTRDQVGISAALADCNGVSGSGVRRLEVTRLETLLDHRQQQIPALGALARATLQEPLGTREPTRRAAHLATHEQAKADPEGTANGGSALAASHMSLVGPLECRKIFIVPTDQVCRHRQELEILDGEGSFQVGKRECSVGIRPRALPI